MNRAITSILNDDAKEIEGRIAALNQVVRTTRTTMTNDRLFNDACEAHRKAIELHTRQLAELERVRSNGPEIIATTEADIARLRKRLRLVKRKAELKKLAALTAKIEELQS